MKNLLQQLPTVGPLRRDHHTQLIKFKKANKSHGLQAPKLKVALTHSSPGGGSGHRRRCPFRVRFADETLWDTALRYWERSNALQQGIFENGPAPESATPERVFGNIRRWLDSLSKALDSRAKEETMVNSPFSWDGPNLPILKLQSQLSEDTSINSRLPFIPKATTKRHQRDHKTFLGSRSIPNRMSKSPCSWSQKLESFLPHLELHTVLKRGHPTGYQPLQPPVNWQQARL